MVVISTSPRPVNEKNFTSLNGLGESILIFEERLAMYPGKFSIKMVGDPGKSCFVKY
jgi:hypothetical protein